MFRIRPRHRSGASILKKRRYADIYEIAFAQRSTMQTFVDKIVCEFKADPIHNVRTPSYVHTVLTTQSIAEKERFKPYPDLAWTFSVVRFMERRAARLLTRAALEFLYRPEGWYVRMQCKAFRWAPVG